MEDRMATWTHIIAAAVVTLVAPSKSNSASVNAVSLRYHDAGRHIPVRLGEEIEIVLPTNLGSRFYWTPRANAKVTLLAPPRVVADPTDPKCDATVIRFLVSQPGKTTIEVAEVPFGGGGGAASNVLKYHFAVVA
jgi:hypothetical protein